MPSFDMMMNDPERARRVREENAAADMRLATMNNEARANLADVAAQNAQDIAHMQYGPDGSVDRQLASQRPVNEAHAGYYNMQSDSGRQEMAINNKLLPTTLELAKQHVNTGRFNAFKRLAGVNTTAAAVSPPVNSVTSPGGIATPSVPQVSGREEDYNNFQPTRYKRLNSLARMPFVAGPAVEHALNWLTENE